MNFGWDIDKNCMNQWRLLPVHGWKVNSEFWQSQLDMSFLDWRDSHAVAILENVSSTEFSSSG